MYPVGHPFLNKKRLCPTYSENNSQTASHTAVNISRAMERILYERFLDVLSKNSHVTQAALFPVTVQVGAENMCLFEEHAQMLSGLGFDITPFGI